MKSDVSNVLDEKQEKYYETISPKYKNNKKKKPINDLVGKVHNTDCIRLMSSIRSNSISMIFADPPFNLKKKYKSYKDDLLFYEYIDWTRKWLSEACRILKTDGSIFVYNIPRLLIHTTSILDQYVEFKHWIAWNSNGQPLGKTLQPAHYGILFYVKSKQSKFYDVRAPHAKCRSCDIYLKDYGGKKHLRHPFGYQISDVWSDIHRVRHKCRRIDNHPCQLPVHLIERMILMTTDEKDIVLDPFCGGGSAAVAAKQLGRRYIGCEIDKEYAEVANRKYNEAKASRGINNAYVSMYRGKIVSMRNVDIVK